MFVKHLYSVLPSLTTSKQNASKQKTCVISRVVGVTDPMPVGP